MSAAALARLAELGLEFWLAGLAIIVAWSLFTHPERLNGLLSTKGSDIDPERLQSLLVMAFGVGAYVLAAAHALALPHPPRSLPEMPQSLLTLLTGSQVLYLAGKIGRTIKLTPPT